MNNIHSLRFFWPESVLTVAVLAMLVQDLLVRRSPRRVGLLTIGALFWLALTALATWRTPWGNFPIFGGLLVHDPLRIFFAWLFLAAALLTVVIVPRSKEISSARLGEFFALLFALLLGMYLMASAADLLLIYLSIETVSLVSYVLTGFQRGRRRANEAALKYVIYGGVASGIMLYGISILYGLFGTTRVAGEGGIGAQLADVTSRLFLAHAFGGQPAAQLALVVAVVFLLAGVGYKIAAVPFHMWSPDVYEGAPTPFTAFLSVGPKAAGFAVAIRFFFAAFERQLPGGGYAQVGDLPWPAIIGIISAISMTLGNLTAIVQSNVKRLLAYSSIAHAGYLLMGLAAASTAGVQSILIYLIIYVLMNVGAFLVVIAVSRETGGEDIKDFRGLGTRAPIAALALVIFLFSLTGIPPFAGFIGKYLIFAAVVQRGGFWNVLLAVIGVLNSAISLFYYARLIKAMYLEEAIDQRPFRVPAVYTGVLVALAVPNSFLIFYWTPLVRWAAAAFGGSPSS
ncbi:MAG: NADH-quinone oxidoreductase subunit N [Deltaproteobacteria bacterium]|nr:MAG: NADH-quinone oxidoreductase subunit N [Deltaproteobacteria bacterium]